MDSSDFFYVLAAADNFPDSVQLVYEDSVPCPRLIPRSSSHNSSGSPRLFTVYDEHSADVTEEFSIEEYEYVVDENGEVCPVNSECAVLTSLNCSESASTSMHSRLLESTDAADTKMLPDHVVTDDIQVKAGVAVLANGIDCMKHHSSQHNSPTENSDPSVECADNSENSNGESVGSNGTNLLNHKISHEMTEISNNMDENSSLISCSRYSLTVDVNSCVSPHSFESECLSEAPLLPSPSHCNGVSDCASEAEHVHENGHSMAGLSKCSLNRSNCAIAVDAGITTSAVNSSIGISDTYCRTADNKFTDKHCVDNCAVEFSTAHRQQPGSTLSDLNSTSIACLSTDCASQPAENTEVSSATDLIYAEDKSNSADCLCPSKLYLDGISDCKTLATDDDSDDQLLCKPADICNENCIGSSSTCETCSCKAEIVLSDESGTGQCTDAVTCSLIHCDNSNGHIKHEANENDAVSDIQSACLETAENCLLTAQTSPTSLGTAVSQEGSDSLFSAADSNSVDVLSDTRQVANPVIDSHSQSSSEALPSSGNVAEVRHTDVESFSVEVAENSISVMDDSQLRTASLTPPQDVADETAMDYDSDSVLNPTLDTPVSPGCTLADPVETYETTESSILVGCGGFSETAHDLLCELRPECTENFTLDGCQHDLVQNPGDSCITEMKQRLRDLYRMKHRLRKLQRNVSRTCVGDDANKLPSDTDLSILSELDIKRVRLESVDSELTKRKVLLLLAEKQLKFRLRQVEQREQMLRLRERLLQKRLPLPREENCDPVSTEQLCLVAKPLSADNLSGAVNTDLSNDVSSRKQPAGADKQCSQSEHQRSIASHKSTKRKPALKHKPIAYHAEPSKT